MTHRVGKPGPSAALAAFAVLAATAPSQAQIAASLDGTYAGVSAHTVNDGGRGGCPADMKPDFVPRPLTISQGRIQGQWGTSDVSGPVQGTVAPDGSVIWRTNFHGFSGRLVNGTLTGRVTWRNGCNWDPVVWRKQ
jgi:hypothetical protein